MEVDADREERVRGEFFGTVYECVMTQQGRSADCTSLDAMELMFG